MVLNYTLQTNSIIWLWTAQ